MKQSQRIDEKIQWICLGMGNFLQLVPNALFLDGLLLVLLLALPAPVSHRRRLALQLALRPKGAYPP